MLPASPSWPGDAPRVDEEHRKFRKPREAARPIRSGTQEHRSPSTLGLGLRRREPDRRLFPSSSRPCCDRLHQRVAVWCGYVTCCIIRYASFTCICKGRRKSGCGSRFRARRFPSPVGRDDGTHKRHIYSGLWLNHAPYGSAVRLRGFGFCDRLPRCAEDGWRSCPGRITGQGGAFVGDAGPWLADVEAQRGGGVRGLPGWNPRSAPTRVRSRARSPVPAVSRSRGRNRAADGGPRQRNQGWRTSTYSQASLVLNQFVSFPNSVFPFVAAARNERFHPVISPPKVTVTEAPVCSNFAA